MKYTLLFLFLSLSLFTLKAQTYLNSTARWTQINTWTGSNNAFNNCKAVYYVAGDSVVNDTSYLKLNVQTICYFTHMVYDSEGNGTLVTDTTNLTNGFSLLLREENKRFIVRGEFDEYWLYNFNVNDFAPIYTATASPSCEDESVSLLTHDTVCIGAIERKRWMISTPIFPSAYYFIEGVGPSSGFAAPICRNDCPECEYGLTYFELNGDTLYHGSCSITGIENASDQSDFTFQYGMNSLSFQAKQLQWIELYSAAGLRTHILQADAGKVEINTNELASGIYIYRAWVDGKMKSGKVMVSQ